MLATREVKRQEAAALIQRCWRAHKAAKAEAWMQDFLGRCLEACQALKQARWVPALLCWAAQAPVALLRHPPDGSAVIPMIVLADGSRTV